MSSHAIDSADICLWLAESAPPDQRRILLELAGRWLKKAPHDTEWMRLNEELSAWRRKPS